jgi:hypothetical protein
MVRVINGHVDMGTELYDGPFIVEGPLNRKADISQ